ncbi:MAG: hypothetical protein VX663_08060, partial [Pseudomonadota bacterium]|nr:hypothetical protein [Pseudomonadota bacterium]
GDAIYNGHPPPMPIGDYAFISGDDNSPLTVAIEALPHLASSSAHAINDKGNVVGSSKVGTQIHAVLWRNKTAPIDLGTLGGNSSNAVDVNNLDQVIGYSHTASGEQISFLWDEENGMRNLSELGLDGFVESINDSGLILGRNKLFDISTGDITELGDLGGGGTNSRDLNNVGHAVGFSRTDVGDQNAFLWSEAFGTLNLNDLVTDLSGWQYLKIANGISPHGRYITGEGVTADGERHAFLLVQAPEPSLFTLFLLGIAMVSGMWGFESLRSQLGFL